MKTFDSSEMYLNYDAKFYKKINCVWVSNLQKAVQIISSTAPKVIFLAIVRKKLYKAEFWHRARYWCKEQEKKFYNVNMSANSKKILNKIQNSVFWKNFLKNLKILKNGYDMVKAGKFYPWKCYGWAFDLEMFKLQAIKNPERLRELPTRVEVKKKIAAQRIPQKVLYFGQKLSASGQ